MIKIEAYIKSHRLTEVIEQLHTIDGLTGVSVHDIQGFGRTREQGPATHIVDNTLNETQHVKLEIVCIDCLVEEIIQAIQHSAHTGLRSDGKIYISRIEDAVRISTGERGEAAV